MKWFESSVRNKTVAVVGNASSLLQHDFGEIIDACDLVIRMNLGFVQRPESQGSRTDIVVTSIPIEMKDLLETYSPQGVIWATSKRRRIPADYYHNKHFHFELHPLHHWWALRWRLEARPSTGAILLNYLWSRCSARQVSVFGFDGFRSPTFYESRKDIGPHCKESEDAFVSRICASKGFGRFPNPSACSKR